MRTEPVDARRRFPRLGAPPHDYYDNRNEKGGSPYRPGLAPEVYRAFIAHFDERAVTCDAQARLDRRKRRLERAARYEDLARQWRAAARVAVMRMQRELRKHDEGVPMPTDLFGRPIATPAQQLELELPGRTRLGTVPAPPRPWFCPRCNHTERQLSAIGPDRCAECGLEVRS